MVSWSFRVSPGSAKGQLRVQPLDLEGVQDHLSRLTCPSFTSRKQYLNSDDCWTFPPPHNRAPPAGAGAPADPEDVDDASVCRAGPEAETCSQGQKLR